MNVVSTRFARLSSTAQEEVARRVNNPPDQVEKSWEYDEPSQFAQLAQSENDEVPPTPILDAYEKSRCPKEMERLIQMSFDVLPKRDGPRRNNHKRREKQRFKTIRVSVVWHWACVHVFLCVLLTLLLLQRCSTVARPYKITFLLFVVTKHSRFLSIRMPLDV